MEYGMNSGIAPTFIRRNFMVTRNENLESPEAGEPAGSGDFFADKPHYNPEVPGEMAVGMLYYAEKFGFVAGHVLCEKFPPTKTAPGSDTGASAAGIAGRISSLLVCSILEKLRLMAAGGDKWAEQVSACLEQQYRKLWQERIDGELKDLVAGGIILSSVEKQKFYDPFSFLQGASYGDEDMQNNPVVRVCALVMGEHYPEEEHPRAGAFLMDMAGAMLKDYFDCFWQEADGSPY
jgi:hypothetical protein